MGFSYFSLLNFRLFLVQRLSLNLLKIPTWNTICIQYAAKRLELELFAVQPFNLLGFMVDLRTFFSTQSSNSE